MRITLMCPKCGCVKGCDENDRNNYSDICEFCNIKREIIDFDESLLDAYSEEDFHIIEQEINRKFLFHLPTFDEEAYNTRLKIQNEAIERCNQRARELANGPHCPICNSANIHKISGFNKAASIGLFGVFSIGHVSKTFKCDHCGAKF